MLLSRDSLLIGLAKVQVSTKEIDATPTSNSIYWTNCQSFSVHPKIHWSWESYIPLTETRISPCYTKLFLIQWFLNSNYHTVSYSTDGDTRIFSMGQTWFCFRLWAFLKVSKLLAWVMATSCPPWFPAHKAVALCAIRRWRCVAPGKERQTLRAWRR